jgi:predicted transcriptional regulator
MVISFFEKKAGSQSIRVSSIFMVISFFEKKGRQSIRVSSTFMVISFFGKEQAVSPRLRIVPAREEAYER